VGRKGGSRGRVLGVRRSLRGRDLRFRRDLLLTTIPDELAWEFKDGIKVSVEGDGKRDGS